MIPLSIPKICGNEWRYIKECLDTGWVSSAGKFVDQFEKRIASYIGSRYAVSCVNGTSALHMALLMSGIGESDEVIVPTVTFIAPVNAVRYAGANPVFMDCDDYLNIDAEKTKDFIEKECRFKNGRLYNKATKNIVKAILPVHVFGHPADMEPILDLAKAYGLKVIEDATESLGSYYKAGKYRGIKAGAIGDIGCLSFNGNKIITTGGGGMIVTNDKKTADKARYLTTQAKDDRVRYVHNEIGYNYRLNNIQAAMGLAQLENLKRFVDVKRANFKYYHDGIKGIDGIKMLGEPPYGFSNRWLYSLIVDKRLYGMTNLELIKLLAKNGIESRPLWQLNHRQRPYRKNISYRIDKAPLFYEKIVNVPCSVGLAKKDIKKILRIIKDNAKN